MVVSGSWVGSSLPDIKLPERDDFDEDTVELKVSATESVIVGDLGDDFDKESKVETRWGSFGNFQLVGNGGVTNEHCGTFFRIKACSRVELHNRIKYVKVNVGGKESVVRTTGKVDRKIVFHYCNKPSCSICYKYGWAYRLAGNVERRLVKASKRWGLVEHIVVGIPSKFWNLSYKELKKKCLEGCSVRNVIGGVLIFHGFRYNDLRPSWYWSPHFHILGFIFGGYKCRGCKKILKSGKCGIENIGCVGFVNRNYRENEKDGLYFKVKGKRKTIWGTSSYLLDHSCIDVTKKRPRVTTWFGVASYRKLKVTVEKHKDLCRICKNELTWHDYHGSKHFVTNRKHPDFKLVSLEDADENGVRVYVERAPEEYG